MSCAASWNTSKSRAPQSDDDLLELSGHWPTWLRLFAMSGLREEASGAHVRFRVGSSHGDRGSSAASEQSFPAALYAPTPPKPRHHAVDPGGPHANRHGIAIQAAIALGENPHEDKCRQDNSEDE